MSDYIYERAQAIHKERKDIPSELLKMAETIDSESLPLDPNAYTLALYDGFFRLWTRYGAEAERERIIALLEAEHSEFTYQHQENKRVYIDDCSACFAIALIKGDNK